MALETATYLTDLVVTNPAATDGLAQADDHIRLVKSTIKNTFTAMNAATTVTPTDLNNLHSGIYSLGSGSSGSPSVSFAAEATLGLYRKAAGQVGLVGKLDVSSDLSVSGQISGNGSQEVGQYCQFPFVPSTMGSGGGSTTGYRYLECDGSLWSVSSYPALASKVGTLYGGDGVTTFGVPNLKTTGAFLRSRHGSVVVGQAETSANLAHTHVASGSTDFAGSHDHGGVTSLNTTDHTHVGAPSTAIGSYVNDNAAFQNATTAGGNLCLGPSAATSGQSAAHVHLIGAEANHVHGISITTTSTGSPETRPECMNAVICLKT